MADLFLLVCGYSMVTESQFPSTIKRIYRLSFFPIYGVARAVESALGIRSDPHATSNLACHREWFTRFVGIPSVRDASRRSHDASIPQLPLPPHLAHRRRELLVAHPLDLRVEPPECLDEPLRQPHSLALGFCSLCSRTRSRTSVGSRILSGAAFATHEIPGVSRQLAPAGGVRIPPSPLCFARLSVSFRSLTARRSRTRSRTRRGHRRRQLDLEPRDLGTDRLPGERAVHVDHGGPARPVGHEPQDLAARPVVAGERDERAPRVVDAPARDAERLAVALEGLVHRALVQGELFRRGHDEIVGRGLASEARREALRLPAFEELREHGMHRHLARDGGLRALLCARVALDRAMDEELAERLERLVPDAPAQGRHLADPAAGEEQDAVDDAAVLGQALVREEGHDLLAREVPGRPLLGVLVDDGRREPARQSAGRDRYELLDHRRLEGPPHDRVDVPDRARCEGAAERGGLVLEPAHEGGDVLRPDLGERHRAEHRAREVELDAATVVEDRRVPLRLDPRADVLEDRGGCLRLRLRGRRGYGERVPEPGVVPALQVGGDGLGVDEIDCDAVRARRTAGEPAAGLAVGPGVERDGDHDDAVFFVGAAGARSGHEIDLLRNGARIMRRALLGASEARGVLRASFERQVEAPDGARAGRCRVGVCMSAVTASATAGSTWPCVGALTCAGTVATARSTSWGATQSLRPSTRMGTACRRHQRLKARAFRNPRTRASSWRRTKRGALLVEAVGSDAVEAVVIVVSRSA